MPAFHSIASHNGCVLALKIFPDNTTTLQLLQLINEQICLDENKTLIIGGYCHIVCTNTKVTHQVCLVSYELHIVMFQSMCCYATQAMCTKAFFKMFRKK